MIRNLSYEGLYFLIQGEVLLNGGAGFTVQLAPKFTQVKEFEPAFSLLKGYYWRYHVLGNGADVSDSYRFGSYGVSLKWYVSLTKELETALPRGLLIRRTSPEILLDQHSRQVTQGTLQNAYYVEGQRVYLTVSDEYASRVFKDVYTDIGLPFRDQLLTKHSHILKTILSKIHNVDIRISKHGINMPIISFYDLGMIDLSSYGQMYGMALALIETIKETLPDYSHYFFKITNDTTGYINISMQKPTTAPKKMKEW